MSIEDIIEPSNGDNIIRTKEWVPYVNPNGVAHEIYAGLKKNKNKCAQIDAVSGVSETFHAVLERSVRVACHLKKMGVTPKDILTPCTTNHLNTSVILYAIFFTGAKPASLDPGAPEEDKLKQLQLVKPKYIFATPECVPKLEIIIEKLSLDTKIVVFGETSKHISFDDLLTPLPEEEKNFKVYTTNNVFDTAMIVFSSGTTGSPKGICITHYQILAILSNQKRPLQKPDEELPVTMSYASLVWTSGIMLSVMSPVIPQTKLLCSNFEVEKTWTYLEKYKVSVTFFAPQDFLALVRSDKPSGLELPSLKMIAPIGGAVSLETLTKAKILFPTTLVFQAYSQTELWGFGLIPLYTPEGFGELTRKPTSTGKPMKGGIYKVVDPETEEVLGPNKPGELRIKTKMIMNGYYKTGSRDRFDSEGFLKTGDIMYYDECYTFFFVERQKEMLRYKMCAVAPTELEAIIVQHPSVEVAVVLGLPSDEGDIITAVVVKSNNNVTAEELEQLVASQVDDRKRLRGGVKFISKEEIPFTPSGKIKRRLLRQYIMEKN
ncbi:luciferin 4-monooxygenase-like [Onthophagus taurus]|uniref:luciferin 4-monooxygenase-like n=1 Tax=Onthophagus taurus TaxID=166361 RepID=UPI0039BDB648